MTIDDNNQPEAAESASSPAKSSEQSENERRIHSYEVQLRRLSSELALTEARERRAIALDLHDHIGQALAYTRMKLTRLKGNSVFCGFEDDFSELLLLLDQTIRYTRDLTVEISPPVLYELGLVPAIKWLAERAERRHEFKVKTRERGQPLKISEEVQILMFKSLQELIANVAKHTRATKVNIHITWQSDGLQIRIEDNGQGFAPQTTEIPVPAGDGFGLFSIRERLSCIGGSLVIQSTLRPKVRFAFARTTTPNHSSHSVFTPIPIWGWTFDTADSIPFHHTLNSISRRLMMVALSAPKAASFGGTIRPQ